ncbi:hypothetical protein JHS3_11100 [Jeongeupia sp. HS-3]|uniref:L,D-transpeptidase n=1 Tax=Jeongeupia sp. HS-3 TaxID=1009682 RepID=UPI0018A6545E|nr:L,D-transpeptidase [Jeongeupia sp. HS-3]BCL75374.1 hypothetical protein JHS3_11100 [Jeongeupia sp. HS-3]
MNVQIDIASQILRVYDAAGVLLHCYPVSTAARGAGELFGSFQTPRGRHAIRAMIGTTLPLNAVLRGRRWTGEVYSPALAAAQPGRDWILSRIIWLSGKVPGFNRFGQVDTMARYIYIHGTPDDEPMGLPASHGCIRMRNTDIVELFAMLKPGVDVDIVADTPDWCVYPAASRLLSESLEEYAIAGPKSPAIDAEAVGRLFTLWQEEGHCQGRGGLQAGGTLWLNLSSSGIAAAWRLLDVLLDEARVLGWHHVDMLATAPLTPDWRPTGDFFESRIGPIRRYRCML